MKNFSLPVGWRYVSLLDLVDVIGGVAYNPNDITNKGIRIVRGGNIQDNIVKLKDDDVYLPLSYKNDNNSLDRGEIVLVAATDSVEALGRTATVWEDMKDVQIGAFLRILRPKQKQYAAFISAWLSSDHYLKYIKQVAKGTSINNIGQTHLQGFKIPIPLESEIDSISHVYSSLSSKIALNRAINRNLPTLDHSLKEAKARRAA
jgi:type I restriction enzyme S subunit